MWKVVTISRWRHYLKATTSCYRHEANNKAHSHLFLLTASWSQSREDALTGMLLVVVLSCDLPFIPLKHVCRQSTGSAVCFVIAGWVDEMANTLPRSMLFCWQQCHLSVFCRSKRTHQIRSCGQRSWRWWQTRSVWCLLFGQAEWYMTEAAWLASWRIKSVTILLSRQNSIIHWAHAGRAYQDSLSAEADIASSAALTTDVVHFPSIRSKPNHYFMQASRNRSGISWDLEMWCWQAPNFCWLASTAR